VKALTIRNPWGHLIVAGRKPVELRSRPTGFRGRLVVHAGCRPWVPPHPHFYRDLVHRTGCPLPDPRDLPAAALLGTVAVVGCVPVGGLPPAWRGWAFGLGRWGWAWVLADPRPFARPVPFRGGRLGLFELPAGSGVLDGVGEAGEAVAGGPQGHPEAAL
jgi:hypothetical protein